MKNNPQISTQLYWCYPYLSPEQPPEGELVAVQLNDGTHTAGFVQDGTWFQPGDVPFSSQPVLDPESETLRSGNRFHPTTGKLVPGCRASKAWRHVLKWAPFPSTGRRRNGSSTPADCSEIEWRRVTDCLPFGESVLAIVETDRGECLAAVFEGRKWVNLPGFPIRGEVRQWAYFPKAERLCYRDTIRKNAAAIPQSVWDLMREVPAWDFQQASTDCEYLVAEGFIRHHHTLDAWVHPEGANPCPVRYFVTAGR